MTGLTPLHLGMQAGIFLIILAAAIVVASFAAAAITIYIYPYVYPIGRPYRRLPIDDERGHRRISFQSADGVRLAGWYGEGIGRASHATIIMCHGYPGDKGDMLDLAEAVRASGFNVFLFDFRSWGESARSAVTLGGREAQDVVGAVRFLKRWHPEQARRIGIVGLSMGAAAAFQAGAQSPDIHAVVADTSYARLDVGVRRVFQRFLGPLWPIGYFPWRWLEERLTGIPMDSVSPLQAVSGISPRPVLIIHGMLDRLTDVRDAELLHGAAGEPKVLWLIPEAGHAQTRRVDSAEYDARVIRFFQDHLTET